MKKITDMGYDAIVCIHRMVSGSIYGKRIKLKDNRSLSGAVMQSYIQNGLTIVDCSEMKLMKYF